MLHWWCVSGVLWYDVWCCVDVCVCVIWCVWVVWFACLSVVSGVCAVCGCVCIYCPFDVCVHVWLRLCGCVSALCECVLCVFSCALFMWNMVDWVCVYARLFVSVCVVLLV